MATKERRQKFEIGKGRNGSGRRRGIATGKGKSGPARIDAQFPMTEANGIDEQPVKIPFRSR